MPKTARYAIRIETIDGTLEEACRHLSRKADAIAWARSFARHTGCRDIARVHVDDTKTDLLVFFASVPRPSTLDAAMSRMRDGTSGLLIKRI